MGYIVCVHMADILQAPHWPKSLEICIGSLVEGFDLSHIRLSTFTLPNKIHRSDFSIMPLVSRPRLADIYTYPS